MEGVNVRRCALVSKAAPEGAAVGLYHPDGGQVGPLYGNAYLREAGPAGLLQHPGQHLPGIAFLALAGPHTVAAVAQVLQKIVEPVAQVDDAHDLACPVHRKEGVCHHPVGVNGFGAGVAGNGGQPVLIALGLVQQLAAKDDRLPVLKKLLPKGQGFLLSLNTGAD